MSKQTNTDAAALLDRMAEELKRSGYDALLWLNRDRGSFRWTPAKDAARNEREVILKKLQNEYDRLRASAADTAKASEAVGDIRERLEKALARYFHLCNAGENGRLKARLSAAVDAGRYGMSMHTPTPYEAIAIDATEDGKCREWLIRNSRHRAVARIDLVNDEGAETAAFIVRACNAHNNLVAALREMLMTSRQIRGGQCSGSKTKAEEVARAVLALADMK
jgi:hypothetical protein